MMVGVAARVLRRVSDTWHGTIAAAASAKGLRSLEPSMSHSEGGVSCVVHLRVNLYRESLCICTESKKKLLQTAQKPPRSTSRRGPATQDA
eukprot:3694977-Rhodomonas_salina.2